MVIDEEAFFALPAAERYDEARSTMLKTFHSHAPSFDLFLKPLRKSDGFTRKHWFGADRPLLQSTLHDLASLAMHVVGSRTAGRRLLILKGLVVLVIMCGDDLTICIG